MKQVPHCTSVRHQGPLCCWEGLLTQVSHEAATGRRAVCAHRFAEAAAACRVLP
jgi:hypothetical protein